MSICIVWLAMPSASTRDHVTDVRLEAPVGRAATTTTVPPAAAVLPTEVTDAPTAPSTSHPSSHNQTYLAAPPSGAAPTGLSPGGRDRPGHHAAPPDRDRRSPADGRPVDVGCPPDDDAQSTTTVKRPRPRRSPLRPPPSPPRPRRSPRRPPRSPPRPRRSRRRPSRRRRRRKAPTTTLEHHHHSTTTAPTTTAPTTTAPTTSATVTLPTTVIGTVAPPTQDAPPSQEITQ